MNIQQRASAPPNNSFRGGFSWLGLPAVLVAAVIFGAFFAWIAEQIEPYFSPFLLYPLLVGIFVGLSIVGFVRLVHTGHRPTILTAAIVAAVLAAVGQHVFGYCETCLWQSPPMADQALAGRIPTELLDKVRPNFCEYLEAQTRHGRPLLLRHVAYGAAVWLTWGLDAFLIVVGVLAVVIPAFRMPYCNRCRTWYRTVRHGRIDLNTAQRLAEALGVEAVPDSHSPRYRLSACEEGCGPTRCELSWEDRDGAISLATVWLDADNRDKVTRILDRIEGHQTDSDREQPTH